MLAVSNSHIFITRHLHKDSLTSSTSIFPSTHILSHLSLLCQGNSGVAAWFPTSAANTSPLRLKSDAYWLTLQCE
jgi:hypothetical protein